MPVAYPNANTSGSGTLTVEMQTFYDRLMLENMKPKLVHYQYGQQRRYNRNSGKTIQFRKYTPFTANATAMTALTEGTTPDGQALTATQVTATIAQYGGFVAVTDMLNLTALDPILTDSVELMGDQGGLVVDALTRDVIVGGTNVLYASTATSRVTVAQSMKLTTLEIRKAVRTLKKGKAKPFMRGGRPYYIAIVAPDTTFDLQSDSLWQDVSKYSDAEQIFSGEIGRLFGCIFVETTEAKVFAGAGASGADVYATMVIGQDAYGVVEIDGTSSSKPRTIVKNARDNGTNDPLEQISTVGWKVEAYTAVILQQLFMVRIEHGVSA